MGSGVYKTNNGGTRWSAANNGVAQNGLGSYAACTT